MNEEFNALRRRAQEKLAQQPISDLSELSVQDIAFLVEELYIHQAELEIQNEDLRQTQQQLENSHHRYRTLYDFAPLGYFTFDANGLILTVNLTGAALLGLSKNELLRQPFTNYVCQVSQDTFYLHRRQVQSEATQSCELQLIRSNGSRLDVHVESILLVDEVSGDSQMLSALIDITERNQLQNELNEERSLLRTLLDHLPDFIYVKDSQSRFIMGNLAVAKLMGARSVDYLIGKTDFNFYPEALATQYYINEQTVIKSGQPLIDKIEPLIDFTGQRRWLLTTQVPLRNAAGDIMGLVGIGRDITEQNRSERRVKLFQTISQDIGEASDFRTALETTLHSIVEVTQWDYGEAWTLDEEEGVLQCSPIWYSSHDNLETFREQSEQMTFPKNVGLPGQVWASREPAWIQDISTLPMGRFARRQPALEAGLTAAMAVPFLANHRIVVVLVFFMFEARPEDEEMVDLISAVATQLGLIMHRKKVQEDRELLLDVLGRQQEELRALAGRLAEVQEDERQQLAQELHDQIGQNLSALSFNLNFIRRQISASRAEADPLDTRLADSLALVEETTNRIRNLMTELRPPMLDEYGLMDTLEWYADRFTTRTGLQVDFHNEILDRRLPPGVETALFRITQEALTNVAKYAQVNQVTITFSEEDGVARLIIADDGLGFDPGEIAADKERQSLGLLIMKERALAVGGSCRIESQPGQGTQIIIEVSV